MRISQITKISSFITVGAILLTVSSLFMSWLAMERERVSIQREKSLVFWSSELMRASDVLTDEVRRYAATGNKTHYDAYWREINEVKTRDRALEQLRLLGVSAADMQLPEQAKQQSDGLISLEEKSMAAVARGDLDEARNLVFGPQYDAFKAKISGPLEEFSARVRKQGEAEVNWAVNWSVGLTVLSIVFFVITGIYFIYLSYGIFGNRIVKRLNILWSAVNRLADGDLKSDIPDLGGNDEITDLSRALCILRESALNRERLEREKEEEAQALARNRETVSQLVKEFDRAVAEGLGAFTGAATQLRETSQILSGGANRASDEIAQSVQTFQKTSESTQNISLRTDELTQAIRDISEQVSMASTVSLTAEGQAQKTSQTVATLSESAAKIGEVAGLINAIASQTNLLALNATIESARAGEAGKGFAVVANEVKSLAGQTGRATEEITAQIAAVQAATSDTAREIGKIGEMIQSIREVTGLISAAITQQSGATEEIFQHIQEVAGSSENINQNFRQIGDAAQNNIKASDHLIGASDDLRTHSETLRKEVEAFLGRIKKTMQIA